jgi:sulfur-oxidizing protein SoxA
MRAIMRWTSLAGAAGFLVAVIGCAATVPKWESRAISDAQGVVKIVDGKPMQQRYKSGGFARQKEDFSQWRTYAYDDDKSPPPVVTASMPKNLKGDPKEGRKLFMSRRIGPCTGCHLIRGDDVWPAGSAGLDMQNFGEKNYSDEEVYRMIYDMRTVNPNTIMPPWGPIGMLKADQIVHIIAFLKTQKGPLPPEKDPQRDPKTRARSAGFGDNLDPTNNPAMITAEGALGAWAKAGSKGKSCASCHEASPAKSMKGVATGYPKYLAKYGRVMAIEEFLQMHAPETTGTSLPSQSGGNAAMSILVKMQSNGMPVKLDLSSPEMKAAVARGDATFHKKVGKRNNSCADCHSKQGAAGTFLGGRPLGDAKDGYVKHFPLFRTASGKIWDVRKRFQWCMLPLGMNYLASDSIEYAELELYLMTFEQGKPISVPGIRH